MKVSKFSDIFQEGLQFLDVLAVSDGFDLINGFSQVLT